MAGHKFLTIEERREIDRLLKTGISISEVARQINRSKNGIVEEIRRNGGRLKYNSEIANQHFIKTNEAKKLTLSILNTGKPHPNHYKERLDNIDMQLEIIFNILKENKENGSTQD